MAGGQTQISWTIGALEDVQEYNRVFGDLDKLAGVMGTTRQDVDQALWFLFGRTPAQALEAMAAAKAGAAA